jgi:hypothetical protein
MAGNDVTAAFKIKDQENGYGKTKVGVLKLKAGLKMLRGVPRGWPRVLSSLYSFLETCKGLNIFCGR